MEVLMATDVKIFCDWCGQEVTPTGWLHRLRIFPITKRYWEYRGYSMDIDRGNNLIDDMICPDCKRELVHFVEERKERMIMNEKSSHNSSRNHA